MDKEIIDIYEEKIIINEPFLDFSSKFANLYGTTILISGGNLDCTQYNIIGIKPWLSIIGKKKYISITIENQTIILNDNPFKILKEILAHFNINNLNLQKPFSCGLLGYLSYDLKDDLEKLPRTSIDDLNLPDICLFSPSILIVQDILKQNANLYIPIFNKENCQNLKNFLIREQEKHEDFKGDFDGIKSNFTKSNYIEAIDKIKSYIVDGHVYQVNLSHRFEMAFNGSPFSLFCELYNNNPAPFFAYINAGDHQIVSSSPERFIKRAGEFVETRPIKGTRPRGNTIDEDKNFRLDLSQSKKDDAELSMIVDLLRNDIGKVCKKDSIRVSEHKRIEAYQNVYHLVSIINGIIDEQYDSIDLIKAIFPGGSITGCPKIRAMEIIDELEPNRRHIYTGSIGYISFHDTIDLSIAIRTAIVYKDKIYFSVGGGIVYDSNCFDEYDETLHKAKTFMDVFKGKSLKSLKTWTWHNGSIIDSDEAKISALSLGYQYGYGIFETIRVVKGKIKFLDEHIKRFNYAFQQIFNDKAPDLTWDTIINQVIEKNLLSDKISAIKIMASKKSQTRVCSDYDLTATARLYTHRLENKEDKGLNLMTYHHERHSPLADHKTFNYLYYFLAGKWAKEHNADEALILNLDHSISETNSANLLFIKNKTIFLPKSNHVLSGIMGQKVCELLFYWGYNIESKKIYLKDFFDMDQALATNSLMGAVNILSLDNKKLLSPSNLWIKINDELLF